MMLMIANMSGQSGVTNVALHNLSIAHSTQTGTNKNAPTRNDESESPISIDLHSSLKSSSSQFSVCPEIPELDPGVAEVDLISDINNKTLTPQKYIGKFDNPFSPLRKMPEIKKRQMSKISSCHVVFLISTFHQCTLLVF